MRRDPELSSQRTSRSKHKSLLSSVAVPATILLVALLGMIIFVKIQRAYLSARAPHLDSIATQHLGKYLDRNDTETHDLARYEQVLQASAWLIPFFAIIVASFVLTLWRAVAYLIRR